MDYATGLGHRPAQTVVGVPAVFVAAWIAGHFTGPMILGVIRLARRQARTKDDEIKRLAPPFRLLRSFRLARSCRLARPFRSCRVLPLLRRALLLRLARLADGFRRR